MESLNFTLGEFVPFEPLHEPTAMTDPIATTENDNIAKDENPTTSETTESSTISFEIPTENQGSTTTVFVPPTVGPPPKCNVQVGQGNCLIACVDVNSEDLLNELSRAIREDLIVSIKYLQNTKYSILHHFP
jgi:hypothetical protein